MPKCSSVQVGEYIEKLGYFYASGKKVVYKQDGVLRKLYSVITDFDSTVYRINHLYIDKIYQVVCKEDVRRP